MKKIVLLAMIITSLFSNEIIIKKSTYSVDKTISNLKNILSKKGLEVFAVVNHKNNAAKVDMQMNEACVIIFGNPKMGTKLMNNNILSALDLPLKILVYKDVDSQVKVAYRDGDWLKSEYSLTLDKLTDKVNKALNNITNKAIK